MLVWEGSTIHGVSACEAGMSVQGGLGSQFESTPGMKKGLSVGHEPKCA